MKSKSFGKFEIRCKLCRLGKTHPDILKQVYDWRFGEDMPLETICPKLNTLLDEKGILAGENNGDGNKIKPFNATNLWKHFNEHLSSKQQLHYIRQTLVRTPALLEPVDPVTEGQSRELQKKKLDLFEKLVMLYEDLKMKYDEYDYENDGLINNANVNSYLKIAQELRHCLESLDKMRQQERLINAVIDFVLQNYISTAVGNLMGTLMEVREEMEKFFGDPSMADGMSKRFQDSFSKSLQTSTTRVLKDVKSEFGLN